MRRKVLRMIKKIAVVNKNSSAVVDDDFSFQHERKPKPQKQEKTSAVTKRNQPSLSMEEIFGETTTKTTTSKKLNSAVSSIFDNIDVDDKNVSNKAKQKSKATTSVFDSIDDAIAGNTQQQPTNKSTQGLSLFDSLGADDYAISSTGKKKGNKASSGTGGNLNKKENSGKRQSVITGDAVGNTVEIKGKNIEKVKPATSKNNIGETSDDKKKQKSTEISVSDPQENNKKSLETKSVKNDIVIVDPIVKTTIADESIHPLSLLEKKQAGPPLSVFEISPPMGSSFNNKQQSQDLFASIDVGTKTFGNIMAFETSNSNPVVSESSSKANDVMSDSTKTASKGFFVDVVDDDIPLKQKANVERTTTTATTTVDSTMSVPSTTSTITSANPQQQTTKKNKSGFDDDDGFGLSYMSSTTPAASTVKSAKSSKGFFDDDDDFMSSKSSVTSSSSNKKESKTKTTTNNNNSGPFTDPFTSKKTETSDKKTAQKKIDNFFDF